MMACIHTQAEIVRQAVVNCVSGARSKSEMICILCSSSALYMLSSFYIVRESKNKRIKLVKNCLWIIDLIEKESKISR